MRVGFTGTRHGMSPTQKEHVMAFLDANPIRLGLHGDCIGADAEFHKMCVVHGIMTWAFPGYSAMTPKDETFRAFCKADFVREPMRHFARNREIVEISDVLLACPFDDSQRGGTWYTINYAIKMRKKHAVFA